MKSRCASPEALVWIRRSPDVDCCRVGRRFPHAAQRHSQGSARFEILRPLPFAGLARAQAPQNGSANGRTMGGNSESRAGKASAAHRIAVHAASLTEAWRTRKTRNTPAATAAIAMARRAGSARKRTIPGKRFGIHGLPSFFRAIFWARRANSRESSTSFSTMPTSSCSTEPLQKRSMMWLTARAAVLCFGCTER